MCMPSKILLQIHILKLYFTGKLCADDLQFEYGAFGISRLQSSKSLASLFSAITLILVISANCTIFFIEACNLHIKSYLIPQSSIKLGKFGNKSTQA